MRDLNTASRFVRAACLPLLLLLQLQLSGCLPPDFKEALTSQLSDMGAANTTNGRISSFLQLKDDRGPAARFAVDRLEILSDGLWLPLNDEPLLLDSSAIGSGQLFMGGQSLPLGSYQRLRMQITNGEIRNADGEYVAATEIPSEVEFGLTAEMTLDAGDSRTLLLTWDVEASVTSDTRMTPALSAGPPFKQLPISLVFISCPEIDTIFVVRADKNWVVDSFGLQGQPTYLALDPDPDRSRLYVLTARERMIKIVDTSSYRVTDFLVAPLNDEPSFMTLGREGRSAFLLDERSGYVTRMDLATGRVLARVYIGDRPTYAAYVPELDQLAVSLSLAQQVVLLDPASLRVMGALNAGSSPEGIAVAGANLYVAAFQDNMVTVYDLQNRRTLSQIPVGFGPRRLLASDRQVYVSNSLEGTLSVIEPSQLSVTQDLFGLGRPQELAMNSFYRRLYVADQKSTEVVVFDENSNLLYGKISLGAKPFGLAVIQ